MLSQMQLVSTWFLAYYGNRVSKLTLVQVISVPVKLLWNVHINWRKKLALAGLFSLSLIVIAFTIVRVSIVGSYNEVTDNLWLFCWSSLEMSLGMFLIPSYQTHPANLLGGLAPTRDL